MMNTVAVPPPFTPEDLLALPDGDLFELVNGHLVERHIGAESSWVGGELYRLIGTFCRENQSGWVWPADGSFQCFPDRPNLVRKPDVSFIRRGRLPGEQLPRGHIRIQPDLAVEVVSPKDLFTEVEQKVGEYLKVGVRLVWVVNPDSRTVWVFRANGTITRLHEQEELSGEDVLPGFHCQVSALFPPPAEASPAS
jgi:Uma2 family endonuclease